MTSPTPALVSGPGALSQRTDGGQPLRHISNAKYGEDKAFIAQQKGAPLGNSAEGSAGPAPSAMTGATSLGGPPTAGSGPTGAPPAQAITPFGAPSANPDQRVTTGMQMGPPARPQVNPQPQQLSSALAPYFAADDTGILQDFAWELSKMGL